MVLIPLLILYLPAGSRIACNGRVHVTSKGLSRRRLRLESAQAVSSV
jgi:hypothetical protein